MWFASYEPISLHIANYEPIALHIGSHDSLQIVSSLQMRQNETNKANKH